MSLILINASIYLVEGGRLGLLPGILFHSCRPSVAENDTYETTGIPSTVWQGTGAKQRADLVFNTTGLYPGSGS